MITNLQKGRFVLEAHGQLDPLLWICGKAAYHSGWEAEKEEEPGGPDSPPKVGPQ